LNQQAVAEPLPTQQALRFGNFLKQLEPRLAAVQGITRIAMVGLNVYRLGEVVGESESRSPIKSKSMQR
jgi:hypothetical protein